MKYPFCFAHCKHCHAFWDNVGGEFVVHRCPKQDGKEVLCQTRLALEPQKHEPKPGEPRLVRAT